MVHEKLYFLLENGHYPRVFDPNRMFISSKEWSNRVGWVLARIILQENQFQTTTFVFNTRWGWYCHFLHVHRGGRRNSDESSDGNHIYETYFSVTFDPFHTLRALRMLFLEKWAAAFAFNVVVQTLIVCWHNWLTSVWMHHFVALGALRLLWKNGRGSRFLGGACLDQTRVPIGVKSRFSPVLIRVATRA